MAVNEWHCACVARCGMIINACASRNWFCIVEPYPQRAQHAINDNFHSYAVEKPLKSIRAQHAKKRLMVINGFGGH